MTMDPVPVLELVGGGLAEWPSGQGPRGESIAPAAFVDASDHDHLLALPHRFHEVGASRWDCIGVWEVGGAAASERRAASPPPPAVTLLVRVRAPVAAAFRIPFQPARHRPLIEAMLRDGTLYICPTTPRLGLNARLARDNSFFCLVDRESAPGRQSGHTPPTSRLCDDEGGAGVAEA